MEGLGLGINFTYEFQAIRLKALWQVLVSNGLRKPLKINLLLFTNSVQKLWVTLKDALQTLTK